MSHNGRRRASHSNRPVSCVFLFFALSFCRFQAHCPKHTVGISTSCRGCHSPQPIVEFLFTAPLFIPPPPPIIMYRRRVLPVKNVLHWWPLNFFLLRHPSRKNIPEGIQTMNWGIKDENVKNMLWSERCRKDSKRRGGLAEKWNMSVEAVQRQVLTPDVTHRDQRFLDQGPSLLASLSRFVSDANHTPQAEYVRAFQAFRKEKSSRPSLRSHGNRAFHCTPPSSAFDGTNEVLEVKGQSIVGGESTVRPLEGNQKSAAAKSHGMRPQTATVLRSGGEEGASLTRSILKDKMTTIVAQRCDPLTSQPKRPMSAVQMRTCGEASLVAANPSASAMGGPCAADVCGKENVVNPSDAILDPASKKVASTSSSNVVAGPVPKRPQSALLLAGDGTGQREPKWKHPVTSSDVYGWTPSCVGKTWEDHRFQHRIVSTDVTKMLSLKL